MAPVEIGGPTRITDPKAIAAITHPVRMRLLAELASRGTARVSDLASALGEPGNSVSFHLRQLARYGLIEHNPEAAVDGRERWWRQTSERGFAIDVEAMCQREGGLAAAGVLRRVAEGHVLALHRTTYRRAIRGSGSQPETPPRRAISDDFAMRLTDAELVQMRLEVMDVLDRWIATSHDRSTADDREPRRSYYGVIMAALESDLFDAYEAQMEPNA